MNWSWALERQLEGQIRLARSLAVRYGVGIEVVGTEWLEER